MKKQIALISLLLFACNVIFPQHDSIASTSNVRNDHPISLHQEGFSDETLVKTPNGYVPIKHLQVHDIVISNDHNNNLQQSLIAGFTKYYTTHCIEIVTDDCICHVAPQQKFYISSKKEWIVAEQIKLGDALYTGNGNRYVTHVERIERHLLMYAITVDHHSLYITPSDVLVHNMDPLLGGIGTIAALGATNPIGAIVVPALVITAATGILIYRLCKLSEKPKQAPIDQFNNAAALSEQPYPTIIYQASAPEQQLHTHEIDNQKPKKQPPQNIETDQSISSEGSEMPPEDPEDENRKTSNYEKLSNQELLKAKRSFTKRIEEHAKKLIEYINDPDKFDNKNYLKNAPFKREQIINGRIKELKREIAKFENQIQEIDAILAVREIL